MAKYVPEPCTEEAYDWGCSCSSSQVHATDVDPPHAVINKWCPLHGGLDPDEELEKRRERDGIYERNNE